MGRVISTPDGNTETYIRLSDAVYKAKELCGSELIDFILEETSESAFNSSRELNCLDPLFEAADVQTASSPDEEYSVAEYYQGLLTEIRDIIDERITPLIEGRLNRKELTKAVEDIRRVSMNW